MISRYLVDGFVIGGLAVGTAGIFYMAQGLFGPRGNAVLQGLLVAVLYALMLGFAQGINFSALSTAAFHIGNLSAESFGRIFGAVFGFVVGYTESVSYKRYREKATALGGKDGTRGNGRSERESWLQWQVIVAAVIVSLSTAPLFAAFGGMPLLPLIVFPLTIGAIFISLFAAAYWASGLTDRQLQFIGLGLTLLGVATQAIQPVCDLLGVKIV